MKAALSQVIAVQQPFRGKTCAFDFKSIVSPDYCYLRGQRLKSALISVCVRLYSMCSHDYVCT